MTEVVFIYTLADPRSGEVRYVGKAFDLKERIQGHLLDKSSTHKACWIRQLKRLGLKPEIEAVESFYGASDEEWQEAERFWIETLRFYGCRLTNLESGGIGGKRLAKETKEKISRQRMGIVYSPETRAAMSNSHKGVKLTPQHGKSISESLIGKECPNEKRLKIARSLKGHIVSEATREKIRISLLGRKIGPASEEKKAKMRAALTGRPLSKEHCEKLSLAQRKYNAEHGTSRFWSE